MKISILAIRRNEEILVVLLRLLNSNNNWSAVGAQTDEQALLAFQNAKPSIVLLSNGIDNDSENKLRNYFTQVNPGVVIIQHYGGGSGLLTNEIIHALNKKTSTNSPG